MPTRIVASFVLRVLVTDGRWRIEVRDVRGGPGWTFDSFDAARVHLERLARRAPT